MTEERFELFFSRHFRPLVQVLWGYCGDRDVAEEAAQDALVRASRGWEKVSGMMSPDGWLYRVAINEVNSFFRRRRIERKALRRAERKRPGPSDTNDTAVADRLLVREAMRELPDRQRQALALFYFSDLSVVDVAQAMGAPEGTVKSLLFRGRDALAERLNVELPEEASDAH